MTLMTEKIGQGSTRRCDARCYNAKRVKCTCICGGLNHKAGLKQATQNVEDVFFSKIAHQTTDLHLGKELKEHFHRWQQKEFDYEDHPGT